MAKKDSDSAVITEKNGGKQRKKVYKYSAARVRKVNTLSRTHKKFKRIKIQYNQFARTNNRNMLSRLK